MSIDAIQWGGGRVGWTDDVEMQGKRGPVMGPISDVYTIPTASIVVPNAFPEPRRSAMRGTGRPRAIPTASTFRRLAVHANKKQAPAGPNREMLAAWHLLRNDYVRSGLSDAAQSLKQFMYLNTTPGNGYEDSVAKTRWFWKKVEMKNVRRLSWLWHRIPEDDDGAGGEWIRGLVAHVYTEHGVDAIDVIFPETEDTELIVMKGVTQNNFDEWNPDTPYEQGHTWPENYPGPDTYVKPFKYEHTWLYATRDELENEQEEEEAEQP